MTFLCCLGGLWLLVRQCCGISARVERHQIKWERFMNSIAASFGWLPVVRWGRGLHGIAAITQ
ncbi:MAG: hypothetical protein HOK46_00140 [Alphaproteobacteria bacterium]|nr:hypothetical protein [Alphaproteobacteria bacterium]